MTDPIDFLADTEDGQRSITITPVLLTPTTGVLYVTGQYNLTEGEVGIGSITFNNNNEWEFDGVTDFSEAVIEQIAEFIKIQGDTPAGFVDEETNDADQENTPALPQATSDTLNFIVEDAGMPVDVRVVMNYPFYDVTIAGTITGQLEQYHHSNWFVSNGQLNDKLVQAIGRRITAEITGY